MTKIALTIAGSDSGGGAGIQADLRTFAFHQIHGTSALTCVTAQNTVGVNKVAAIKPEMVEAQLIAICEDIRIDAVKTGMLLNREIITTVAHFLKQHRVNHLVVDPVMVSRAGARLIDDLAIASLRELLLPHASVVTPNRYEAEILSDRKIETIADLKQAAKIIYQKSNKPVLIKGGGLVDTIQSTDIFFDGNELSTLTAERVKTNNTHGTGCTLSAAITANLALGKSLFVAIEEAKNYVTQALKYSLTIGRGSGPVGHFFPLLEK